MERKEGWRQRRRGGRKEGGKGVRGEGEGKDETDGRGKGGMEDEGRERGERRE